MTLDNFLHHLAVAIKRRAHQLDITVDPNERGYMVTLTTPCGKYDASRFYTLTDIMNAQTVTIAATVNHMVLTIAQKVLDDTLGKEVIDVRP